MLWPDIDPPALPPLGAVLTPEEAAEKSALLEAHLRKFMGLPAVPVAVLKAQTMQRWNGRGVVARAKGESK